MFSEDLSELDNSRQSTLHCSGIEVRSCSLYTSLCCREVVQELTDEYIASTRPDYISRGSAKVRPMDPLMYAQCVQVVLFFQ